MLTTITLHGTLGKALGMETWKLAVKSVREALNAIEVLSGRKLYKYLATKEQQDAKFQILINKRPFEAPKPLDINNIETVKSSELVLEFDQLHSIDIVPVLEGADEGVLGVVLGVLLIVVGVILCFVPGFQPLGVALIIGGIGMVVAGVMNLLSSPPEFEDFRQIERGGSMSYLFNGPQNVTKEGGPVPIGYGRLIIGSQVIAASYEVSNKNAADTAITI